VTPGRQRIANIIAAYREHAAALVSRKFFLFADRPGLARAEGFLDYPGSMPPARSAACSISAAAFSPIPRSAAPKASVGDMAADEASPSC
jgi:hypothetical protein